MLDIRTAASQLTPPRSTATAPSLDEVAALRDGNVIPIYREIMADMETPVSAYLKLAAGAVLVPA